MTNPMPAALSHSTDLACGADPSQSLCPKWAGAGSPDAKFILLLLLLLLLLPLLLLVLLLLLLPGWPAPALLPLRLLF